MADCVNHPGVESVQSCPRCGQPFCGDCLVELEGATYCGPCKDARVQELQTRTPAPQRPASVTVFGILNIIFGSMGVLWTPFGLVSLLIAPSGSSPNPVIDVMLRGPFMRGWLLSTAAVGIIAAAALLASGIGLLMLKPWGRLLANAYAVYMIALKIAEFVVNFFYMARPLLEQASQATNPAEKGGLIGGAIGGLIGGCFYIIFPILLIIFMTRPSVAQAFRQANKS